MTTSADVLGEIAYKLGLPPERLGEAIGEGWTDVSFLQSPNLEDRIFSADYVRKSSTGYDAMISIEADPSLPELERTIAIGSPKGIWISVAKVVYQIDAQTMKFPIHQAPVRLTEISVGLDEARSKYEAKLKQCKFCKRKMPPEKMIEEPQSCMDCATQHLGYLF